METFMGYWRTSDSEPEDARLIIEAIAELWNEHATQHGEEHHRSWVTKQVAHEVARVRRMCPWLEVREVFELANAYSLSRFDNATVDAVVIEARRLHTRGIRFEIYVEDGENGKLVLQKLADD